MPDVEHSEAREILLTIEEYHDIYILLTRLTDLDVVTVGLQSAVNSSQDARLLFNEVLGKHHNLKYRRADCCTIVENLTFKEAIRMVQRAEESTLKRVEVRFLRNLLNTESSEQAPPKIDGLSFAQRGLKRSREGTEKEDLDHLSLPFILPTSSV